MVHAQLTPEAGGARGPQRPASHRLLLDAIARELALRDPDGSQVRRVTDPGELARAAAGFMVDTAASWQEHLGGFYDVDGVRRVLARGGHPVSKQAVSKRRGLLALTTGSGRVVYPLFQFDAGAPLPGMDAVLQELPGALVSRWTVASWLVSPSTEFGGLSPVALLRAGAAEQVLAAAQSWAGALAA